MDLDAGPLTCFDRVMSTTLIEVRQAKAADASAVASTHDEAWRSAYQGIIPGAELEKLINRRGPQWWDSAIRKGSRVSVLVFGDKVAGYANYGRNRFRSTAGSALLDILLSWITLLVILALCGYATNSIQFFSRRVLVTSSMPR